MVDIAQVIQIASAVIFLHMIGYYIVSMLIKDTSIVDIGWGLGFVLVAWVLLPGVDNLSSRPELQGEDSMHSVHKVVLAIVTFWGLRLALHIFIRKAGKPEDWRYKNWREQWGKNHWWRSLLQVFILQGFLQLIIAAPIIVAAANQLVVDWVSNVPLESQSGTVPYSWNILTILGLALWAVGFFFEAVGDWQLTKFIKRRKKNAHKKTKKNQNTIMKSGLWKYTRHPNYFGEIAQWWGLFFIVLPLEYGWVAIVSPLLITFLLLKVSGITMLEKKYDDNKEYQKYKARTSALIPLPPRK